MDQNLFFASTWFHVNREEFRKKESESAPLLGAPGEQGRDSRVGKGALAIAVDLRKAFDCVDQDLLLELLERMGFPPALTAYLRSCWRAALTNIFFRGTNVYGVPVRRGIRQGDSLSPLLFSTYFELVLRAYS